MQKRILKHFMCYAHKTEKLTHNFLDIFQDQANLLKDYQFEKWIDGDIFLGEGWDAQIQEAIKECDFGLLLLSSTFFTRPYIKDKELARFINRDGEVLKPIIPIGLESFDLGGDLLGLEKVQIYRYQNTPGAEAKFFNELRKNQRINFVQDLLRKMTLKFDKSFPAAKP